MKRALEKRKAQAQADAAALLREMEAADARIGSDDADDAVVEPSSRGGRIRFGSGRQQQVGGTAFSFSYLAAYITCGFCILCC